MFFVGNPRRGFPVGADPQRRRVIVRQASLDICKGSLLPRLKKFPMNYRGGGLRPLLGARDVKGFALKTHQRLRLWKLQAFEKA
ncbi:MAG: hypothetical protein EGR22_03275 [Ruminococcaceae bacterium]|nr:hypothetical protein [Oscillospiraceae bacterium]